MKKGIAVLFVVFLLLYNGISVIAEIGDFELRTLEGTYQVSVTIDNPENANIALKHSYGIEDPLPGDILQREFTVDVKSKDGEFLLFHKGEEIKNSGLSRDKQFFVFNFMYEIKNSSMKNILYGVEAELHYNEDTMAFDMLQPKNLTLMIATQKGSELMYGHIGRGTFTMEKVGGVEEEKEESAEGEDEGEDEDEYEVRSIPRGITFVKGRVEVKRAGTDKWIRARRNMPVNPGDMIRTGKGSYAELGCGTSEFAPATGSDIQLRPLSSITVPEERVKVEKKSKVRVMVDDAMKNVYQLFGKEEFEIETPSAVAGIRGTDFIMDVDEEGNTTFLLNEGSIFIQNSYDHSEVILSSGQKVLSPMNSTLSDVEPLTEEDKADFSLNPAEVSGGINWMVWILLALVLFTLFIVIKKRKK